MADVRESSDILFERRGGAGIVTLNRPKALNALTHDMVRALASRLDEWAGDDAVTRVIVTANGGRAFCAGGDIRALYDLIAAGRHDEALAFFRDEYRLNAAIGRYRKPYLSLIDGIVMGGGVGISIHGSHRVAGEGYGLAMPEVGIGFFPDVGATYALPRLAGEIGTYLALTGARLTAADAVLSGAATHHVRSRSFAALLEALCGIDPVNAVLADFMESVGPGEVMPRRRTIDRAFAWDSVADILAALRSQTQKATDHAEWSARTMQTISGKSPTSLTLALAQMRYGRFHGLADCLRAEFRIVSRIVYGRDMIEGVRAVIVDKDNAPRWFPDTMDAVPGDLIARHFADLPAGLDLT